VIVHTKFISKQINQKLSIGGDNPLKDGTLRIVQNAAIGVINYTWYQIMSFYIILYHKKILSCLITLDHSTINVSNITLQNITCCTCCIMVLSIWGEPNIWPSDYQFSTKSWEFKLAIITNHLSKMCIRHRSHLLVGLDWNLWSSHQRRHPELGYTAVLEWIEQRSSRVNQATEWLQGDCAGVMAREPAKKHDNIAARVHQKLGHWGDMRFPRTVDGGQANMAAS